MEVGVEAEEHSTRVKTLQIVEIGVETEGPLTSPKIRSFADGESQTQPKKLSH